MRVVTSVSAMQRLALGWRRQGRRVAFVPTMGYLHAGHTSLARKARERVKRDGIVVVSIFVNPTQFAPTEDLARYPRDLPRDKRLCEEAGVDVLFVPAAEEMYPAKVPVFSTWVTEERLARGMEAASRPTHFRGVATVVAKLFNIVLPEVAVFGAKDWQQAAVVQQMARDLNFPIKIVVAPTFREKDHLAMSSRNKYLSPEERAQAPVLHAALTRARTRLAQSSAGVKAVTLRRELARLIATQPLARLDYLEFFDPVSLEPVSDVRPGSHMALAVFFGKTRLIDNAPL
jgi:pantoate--beta-alanine ligase